MVRVWLTTSGRAIGLDEQPPLALDMIGSAESEGVIIVDESRTYQEMDGFGASLTDSAAWLIYTQLDATRCDALMRELFDPVDGIGISFLRQPMGATDITTGGLYSYDDRPRGQSDPDLVHFSIDHDLAYIIPVIKQALRLNPAIKVLATPWSPPGWMKTRDSMIGGRLKPEAYGVYARYFVKFIQAYEAQGVPIYAVTVQNETLWTPLDYPGMLMSADEQTEFIAGHLGPAFAAAGIQAKVLVYDHNWDHPEYPERILSDPTASPYIAGTAFHRYGGDPSAQSRVHDAFPDKDIYFTEGSTDVDISFQYMLETLMIDVPRHWAKSVVLWNIAYDHTGGPYLRPGGCAICRPLVTIDTERGTWARNTDYYALGHLSKCVQPGAHRIASHTDGESAIRHVAFANPNRSHVLIALNTRPMQDTSFTVRCGALSYSYTLSGGAGATFMW